MRKFSDKELFVLNDFIGTSLVEHSRKILDRIGITITGRDLKEIKKLKILDIEPPSHTNCKCCIKTLPEKIRIGKDER
jgi:hypothetical protein